ncbi:pullulanase [Roseovarius sp. TE539]|uniref:photosynthetic complex assembly protein PuhC n=1 Tax=Roseovarius sp. TE539 TaxID=2249812 RepID=UPI000DDCEAC3|nr:photosynthetic complex assembly protein PuhC [Roseovarius sp. TE539]RBI73130.1 pullulanase [Roseovarius sp. TE539]
MTQTDFQTPLRVHDKEKIPRFMARAMLALVLTVLALVTLARLNDMPLIATPPPGEIVISRDIVLSGDMAGSATVRRPDGTLIADLTPEEGGFISGVYRVVLHERGKHDVALGTPLTLLQRDTGRLEIHDPSTGWRADLMGFGADNASAFARLLAQ